MLALDTETSGLDFFHGSKPYFVTCCDQVGNQTYWQWDVDPETREPIIPEADIIQIQTKLDIIANWGRFKHTQTIEDHVLVGQNFKFDANALSTIGITVPWNMVRDTLLAGHLLASNQPHNLTDMVMHYIGRDIEPLEKALEEACKKARSAVQHCKPTKAKPQGGPFQNWRIAKKGDEDMPSIKGKMWKQDGWLPRAMANYYWRKSDAGVCWQQTCNAVACAELEGWHLRPPEIWGDDTANGWDPNWTVLSDYANVDPEATMLLWLELRERIEQRQLTAIYKERLKLLEIAYKMEQRGVSVSGQRLKQIRQEYVEESQKAADNCTQIAASYKIACISCVVNSLLGNRASPTANNARQSKQSSRSTAVKSSATKTKQPVKPVCSSCDGTGNASYRLTLPKSGNNDSLTEFCFNQKLLDLPHLKSSKKTGRPSLDKDVIEQYELTLEHGSVQHQFVCNLRDKRKRDTAIGFMDAYQRYWVPLDIYNELGEQLWYNLHPNLNICGTDTLRWSSSNPNSQNISKMESFNIRRCFGPAPGREWWSLDAQNIELRIPAFEAGEQALMEVFLAPNKPPYFGSYHLVVFDVLHPQLFAKDGKACKTLYESTWYQWVKNGNFAILYGAQREKADATYRVSGAYDKIRYRFPKMAQLNDRQIAYANKYGYVQTIPDKSVDPARGYPLLCSRTDQGRIMPTTPLNYHVSGTAMQWTAKAMVRVDDQFQRWNVMEEFDGHITLQVHDELVLDLPRGSGAEPWQTNLQKIRKIQQLMAQGGDDIGVPTPVAVEYHDTDWSKGMAL